MHLGDGSSFIPDTNPIESPFAVVRLRTAAAKWYKKVENATAVILLSAHLEGHLVFE